MVKNSLLWLPLLLFSGVASAGHYLGELTWVEADRLLKNTPVVMIPIGAGAKEHGPHLPMNADAVVLKYLTDHVVKNSDVIVVPPILHGWFPPFRDFPGTEVADAGVFQNYIHQVANSLIKHGAQRIVFLNTGINKATGLPISIVAREVRVETGTPTLVLSWDDLETEAVLEYQEQKEGGHSDEIETSINLYLQPDMVQMDKAKADFGTKTPKDYGGYRPGVFSRNPKDPRYSESGVYGDPTLATKEKGRKTLEIMTEELDKALNGFSLQPVRR